MGPFVSMDISQSGLTAYRLMMDVVASNLANLQSTVTPQGGPYQSLQVILQPGPTFAQTLSQTMGSPEGVQVAGIVTNTQPGSLAYQPGNPLASAQGTVAQSNVDLVSQMSDMIAASRAYDANVSAFTLEKAVEQRALQLGQNA